MPTNARAPFIAVGMIGVLAAFVVVARLPQNSALRGALTGDAPATTSSATAVTDGCAVSAVGLKCRCVVRDEAACKEMDGTFYAKDDGGIDACVQACSAE
jgi:hypothetical protein